jgi:hypothetical protein
MAAGAGALAAAMGGCLERTITVTSEPPGALVTINSVEVGRTPVTTSFLFYGTYDVRLAREGYKPVWEPKKAKAPLYEFPPLDLGAEAIPAEITTDIKWHFVLEPDEPSEAPGAEEGLVGRARGMREEAANGKSEMANGK